MSDVKGDYMVVVNHEEQYSVWPAGREPPAGWRLVVQTGSRDGCLAWIDANWTDMRPLSLRQLLPTTSPHADARLTTNQTPFGGSRDTEKY
jgi:MbtH protein